MKQAPVSSVALDSLDWDKVRRLMPAVIQHAIDGRVLMLGYMNPASLEKTLKTGLVTFYSRSRQCLWTKGETSGHTLEAVHIEADCDGDTLLVLARPAGPVCHKLTPTCFPQQRDPAIAVLSELQQLIADRAGADPESSYTASLLQGPAHRVAQKVGEEGVETALAAVARDDDALTGEAADLLYHLMVLLQHRGLGIDAVLAALQQRRR